MSRVGFLCAGVSECIPQGMVWEQPGVGALSAACTPKLCAGYSRCSWHQSWM